MPHQTAESLKQLLQLEPLPVEGGFFRRTYTASSTDGAGNATLSAIYYLVTPSDFSRFHRVSKDELFHFYAGDPVELIQITPEGHWTTRALGNKLEEGQRPQQLVPANNWQALKLAHGGEWALLGTTVTPAFDFQDFEIGKAAELAAAFPHLAERVLPLCAL